MILLTVNAGSSSIRLAAYAVEAGHLSPVAHHHGGADAGREADVLQNFLHGHGLDAVAAVAHRVVHGGARAPGGHRIDAALEQAIEACVPLAPLHNPAALRWICACREVLGGVPQCAVFDTGFYHDLPEVARAYALPAEWAAQHGVRRYGFHGIAHEAMWRRWCRLRPLRCEGRVVSLQLGAGCSVTAVREGRAMDTSMGFSPLEGLVMATRSGDVDPGLLLHLLRSGAATPAQLEILLYEHSGLLGISGISGDMRDLLASSEASARLAVALYAYRARKYLGAFLAVLGGADAVLFGGGVGEHQPAVRAAILQGMEWAGVTLDAGANHKAEGGDALISDATGRVEVWTIAVDEGAILAEAAHTIAQEQRS